jgi:hypothetical protein
LALLAGIRKSPGRISDPISKGEFAGNKFSAKLGGTKFAHFIFRFWGVQPQGRRAGEIEKINGNSIYFIEFPFILSIFHLFFRFGQVWGDHFERPSKWIFFQTSMIFFDRAPAFENVSEISFGRLLPLKIFSKIGPCRIHGSRAGVNTLSWPKILLEAGLHVLRQLFPLLPDP